MRPALRPPPPAPARPRRALTARFAVGLAALAPALGAASCGGPPASPPAVVADTSRPRTVATGTVQVVSDSLVRTDPARRYAFRVAYPRLAGGGTVLEVVNARIADSLRALADVYFAGAYAPGDTSAYAHDTTVEGGYGEVFLEGDLFSALVEAYAYTGGAHGNHLLLPLNFDLSTGSPLPADALFRPGAPWADTLAVRATADVLARYGPGTLFEPRIPADPSLFQMFTLKGDSLVLHFAPYAVAPYAAGPIRVAVPWAPLAPLRAPGGPVARLAPG